MADLDGMACPKCGAPVLERTGHLERRIATVHERVGEACRSMPKGWRALAEEHRGRPLRSAHAWRLTADGIGLR